MERTQTITKKVSRVHFKPITLKRLRTPENDSMILPSANISQSQSVPEDFKNTIINFIKSGDVDQLKLLIQEQKIDCNQTLLSLKTHQGESVPITLFQFLILQEQFECIRAIYLSFPISEENLNLSYYYAHQMSDEETRIKSIQFLQQFGVNQNMDDALLNFHQAKAISKEKHMGYELIQAVLHGQVKLFDQKISLYYFSLAFDLAFFILEKHVDVLLSSKYRKLTDQPLPLDHLFFVDRFFEAIKSGKKHLIEMFLSVSPEFLEQRKKIQLSLFDPERYISTYDYAEQFAPELTDYLKSHPLRTLQDGKKLKY
ncbi:MAG: hypothetical protein CMF42_04885 [Legionellales bacterium]|nr:hypothetical protein [Legionellales bacterium]OUX67353.1 MAG: hypothetical protein CBD38_03075 [bacterium TMED178]